MASTLHSHRADRREYPSGVASSPPAPRKRAHRVVKPIVTKAKRAAVLRRATSRVKAKQRVFSS